MDNSREWTIQEWIDHKDKEHNGTVGIPCDICTEANRYLNPNVSLSSYLLPKRGDPPAHY